MSQKIRYTALSSAILLAATHVGQLAAQEGAEETVIVSIDRQGTGVEDIPASVHVIDADTLETFRHVHIGEILNTVPGVVFNRGNGQESLMGIRSPVLTGAGSCGAFQTSQDGIPLRGVGFCNVNQLFEANSEQAGTVEIVRGPGSVMFGINALHGAINVISPTLTGDRGGTVSVDAGPHGYGRLNFGYNAGQGEHNFGIQLNSAVDGGYKDASGFDQQKVNLAHSFDSGNIRISTVFSATNLDQETAGYLVGFEAYKIDALKKVNPNPEAFRFAQGRRLHTRIEGDTDAGTWMVTPYYRDTDMKFLMHFLPGTPLEENGHESFGIQSLYAFDLSDTLSWTIGFDLESTDGYLRQTQSGGFGPFPPGKQYDYQVDAQMWSPYAVVNIQSTERDQISFGIRIEDLEYDYDNLMIDGNTREDGTACPGAGCRYSRPSDRSDSFENYTAQLGWVHDLDMGSQYFGNLSAAFRAPQATELYRLQASQTVSELGSENVESIEFGYRANRDRLSYSLSAYFMNKNGVIFQDSSRNNVSGGETSHRGLEFDTRVSLSDALSLNVVASYARHTYEANIAPRGVTILLDGKDMDTAPKFTSNVQLDWRINTASSINVELVHMGSYYTDESNLHKYDGHDVVNFRYRYNSGNAWYVAARVLNILDVDYAERADFSGFAGDRYFVGEPASVYFTIGTEF